MFVVLTPAPLAPTPPVPPAAMATDPASTVASMVWLEVAVRPRLPVAATLELLMYACTSAGALVPSSCEPMRLRASATPIEAPTPAVPPIATAKDALTTVALILAVLVAAIVTFPALLRALPSTCALVLVRMTLPASAPAPLTATPLVPPNPAAIEAAAATALMVADSLAVSWMAPTVVVTPKSVVVPVTPSALAIYACTSLVMVLRAIATPTDTATPVVPPREAASDAAPALVLMIEVSFAVSVTRSAETPVGAALRSPSMYAFTSTPILFSANTPEPLRPSPVVPAAATAAEPASTMELIFWLASAVWVRSPPACTLLSLR